MRGDLPSGTVTFLFTDIEGSTKLLHALGAEAFIVCRLGGALVVDGKPVLAATVLSAGEALLEEIGSSSPWITEMNGERLEQIRAQLDDAAFVEAWEAGQGLTADEAVALARSAAGA